jgi:hypothetical protein
MAHMAHVAVRPGSCLPVALVACVLAHTAHTAPAAGCWLLAAGCPAAGCWLLAARLLAAEAGVAGPSADGHGYGAFTNNFYFL